jgi:hypothetical protein
VKSHVRMFLVREKFQRTGYDVALQVSASLKVQSLNREWTRIHANKYNKFREAADGIRIGTPVPISSASCCSSNLLLRFFLIRVNSRPFAVQKKPSPRTSSAVPIFHRHSRCCHSRPRGQKSNLSGPPLHFPRVHSTIDRLPTVHHCNLIAVLCC